MQDREQASLEEIQRTHEDLERWRARSRQPEQPERGSQLHADACIWPYHPPYEVARQSLVAAAQHLNLARTSINAGEVYPIAHFTVLRGALVGAAQGVWLLAPDEQAERQQRALRVVYEWYRRMDQYNRMIEPGMLSTENEPFLAAQTSHTRDRCTAARELWAATDTLGADEPLLLTKVIRWAAEDTFADPSQVREVTLLWRLMSGDAHALGWQLVTRGRNWERAMDGLGIGAVPGNLASIAEPFMASFRLLKRGWGLFDRRAECTG